MTEETIVERIIDVVGMMSDQNARGHKSALIGPDDAQSLALTMAERSGRLWAANDTAMAMLQALVRDLERDIALTKEMAERYRARQAAEAQGDDARSNTEND